MTATVEHATPPAAAALAALDPDAFTTLVHASIGNDADPAVWDALTHPAVIARTKKCLGSLHADLQTQLAMVNAELDEIRGDGLGRGDEGKREFLEAKADQADWRRRAIGFRRMVERRMALVKSRTPTGPAQPVSPSPGFSKTARKHNRAALELLARAVAGHQQKVLSGGGDEGDDETLWGCLSSITAITAEGELPLTEWLEYLDDARENDGE